MKKWMYVISVTVLTVAFLIPYLASRKEADLKEAQRLKAQAVQLQEKEAKRKADEDKARADAEKRAADRAKEEADKEAKKRADWEAAGLKIKNSTDGYLARADKAQKEASKLEIDLDTLRKQREKLSREAFDSAKTVERAEVDKETAETLTQDLIAQVAMKADGIIHPPPPPAPTPK